MLLLGILQDCIGQPWTTQKSILCPVLWFFFDSLWLLEGVLSFQMENFHINYIRIFIYILMCIIGIFGRVSIFDSFWVFKHISYYFTFFPLLYLSMPLPIIHHQVTCTLLFFSLLLVNSPTTPNTPTRADFYFPCFCSYSTLFTQIWRSGARTSDEGVDVMLFFPRYLTQYGQFWFHALAYKVNDFIFISSSIVFHSVYALQYFQYYY